MTGYFIRNFFLIAVGIVLSISASAQDTMRKRTVEVTSQFKPVLKDAAKINLNAAYGRYHKTPFTIPNT
jgi:hypothetical protein